MSSVQPEDTIVDDAIVLRWLERDHLPTIAGRTRPNSSLFQPSSDGSGTSVCVARNQDEIDQTLALKPNSYWIRLTADQIRGHNLRLEWQMDVETPRHAGIVGWPEAKKQRLKIQRELANECEWQGQPPPVPNEGAPT